MAKYRIPYMLREVVSEIGQNLQICLGIPMNAELPPSTDENSEGTASIHFPSRHFVAKIETGRGHYGQYVRIKSVRCQLGFYGRQTAEEWMAKLQLFAGPLDWSWKPNSSWDTKDQSEGKACFTLEGMPMHRLEMNASNRRSDLPVYEYADSKHPLRQWAAERNIAY